jgi:hypothetical protein
MIDPQHACLKAILQKLATARFDHHWMIINCGGEDTGMVNITTDRR